jgi:hypothetical protein
MVVFIMSNVYIRQSGRGSCYVDNYNPQNGDVITIYADADTGAQILDMYCTSEYGYGIAISITQVQTLTYDSSWGDITITAKFTGDIITLATGGTGLGSVSCSNYNPSNGETVYLDCVPDRKSYLFDIVSYDENFNPIQIPVAEHQSFVYDASWGDVTIEAYFEIKWIYKNLWILSRREWWRKNNF